MSRRTAEANKAIRQAWDRERSLVQIGKGTRDWTPEQQQDILDPEKGKAYDGKGRAFEGQHMKSVSEYPEYQGNPDNIQFLTKEEHLEAHQGNWQNPTTWYYDPVNKTRIFIDTPIPCKAIDLSSPIMTAKIIQANSLTMEENHTSDDKQKRVKELNEIADNLRASIQKMRTNTELSSDLGLKKNSGVEKIGMFEKIVRFLNEHQDKIRKSKDIINSGTKAARLAKRIKRKTTNKPGLKNREVYTRSTVHTAVENTKMLASGDFNQLSSGKNSQSSSN